MLKQLRIRNFAIIDSVDIEFGPGLNILSGETGAGKSIIMDALFLVMGGRASSDLIRAGAEEAVVEALFEVGEDEEIAGKLADLGIPAEDGDLIIRRITNVNGKNRVLVNGALVNISTLGTITSSLIDLCSQHDQQLIARSEEQLLWLDRFGGLEEMRSSLKILYEDWKQKKQTLESLSSDAAQRAQRMDFLNFQIQELSEADLNSVTEDAEIEQELKMLNNSEALFAFASEAEEAVFGSETDQSQPMLDSASVLLNKARSLVNVDAKLAPMLEQLNMLKATLDEIGYFLRDYSKNVSRDEGRLEALNARAAHLTKLKRKYGPTLADVIAHLGKMKAELSSLENHEGSLATAESAVSSARTKLDAACISLSKARARAAKDFSGSVVRELADLHMERARFDVNITSAEEPSSTGTDLVRFQIAANPGEAMGALSKVASGGELSRVMLAMHNVVSSRGGVGVFLFDEVDAGIGGKTAVSVGVKLRRVAGKNQVVCITHLPQVAAFAEKHFSVVKSISKKSGAERTATHVLPLSSREERLQEIARMLGGDGGDRAALAAAKSLLENIESSAKIFAKADKSSPNIPAKRSKAANDRARI